MANPRGRPTGATPAPAAPATSAPALRPGDWVRPDREDYWSLGLVAALRGDRAAVITEAHAWRVAIFGLAVLIPCDPAPDDLLRWCDLVGPSYADWARATRPIELEH